MNKTDKQLLAEAYNAVYENKNHHDLSGWHNWANRRVVKKYGPHEFFNYPSTADAYATLGGYTQKQKDMYEYSKKQNILHNKFRQDSLEYIDSLSENELKSFLKHAIKVAKHFGADEIDITGLHDVNDIYDALLEATTSEQLQDVIASYLESKKETKPKRGNGFWINTTLDRNQY